MKRLFLSAAVGALTVLGSVNEAVACKWYDAPCIAKEAAIETEKAADKQMVKLCKGVLSPLTGQAVGKAGCGAEAIVLWLGECNAALDVETDGWGSAVCMATSMSMKMACEQMGGELLEQTAEEITNNVCERHFSG